jgi:hypothetical protein
MAERLDELALSYTDVGHRAGLSTRTIRALRDGVERRFTAKTLRLVEQALEWPRGTIRAYLDGTPVPQGEPETAVTVHASTAGDAVAVIRRMMAGLDPIDRAALAELLETDVAAERHTRALPPRRRP